jgi:hypothetical protein
MVGVIAGSGEPGYGGGKDGKTRLTSGILANVVTVAGVRLAIKTVISAWREASFKKTISRANTN